MAHTLDPALASLPPRQLFTVLLWGECRGQPLLGQVAVACSIMNRLHFPEKYGETLWDVMTRWAQYSCLWPTLAGEANWGSVRHAAELLADTPRSYLQPRLAALYTLAGLAMEHLLLDPTDGATHYHATSIAPPSWATVSRQSARIGEHLFYRDVP